MRSSDWSSDVCSSDLLHAAEMMRVRIQDLFAQDARRHRRFTCEDVGFYLDFSKQRANEQTMMLLQSLARQQGLDSWRQRLFAGAHVNNSEDRSEEHTSELQSLMRISYAVFCLKKKKYNKQLQTNKSVNRTH